MPKNRQGFQHSSIVASLVVFGLTLIYAVLLWWISHQAGAKSPIWLWLPAAAGLGLSVYFAVTSRLDTTQGMINERMGRMQRQLKGVMQLNQLIADAQSENELIERALPIFSDLTGALACSFMPLDEWGQPLPATIRGKVPRLHASAWSAHLAEPTVRQHCRACSQRSSAGGDGCPLVVTDSGEPYTTRCFPLMHGERMIGLLTLYLPIDQELPADMSDFIEGLLKETTLAIETMRRRGQEITTRQQLELARGSHPDLKTVLEKMLLGVYDALELDAIYLEVRGLDHSFASFQILLGEGDWLRGSEPVRICERIFTHPDRAELVQPTGGYQSLIAIPLRLPDDQIVGVLLAAAQSGQAFTHRPRLLLEMVAAQAALLVENEQKSQTLELRSVLQERIRLAREIHDGLAQTLAFLKINAAQMQAYLARHDFEKLEKALGESYQTLTDAYTDTRQVIDNLRLSPEKGMLHWLEHISSEFEAATRIAVELNFGSLSYDLKPEAQVQVMRIAQEALNNARKHAEASQVKISLREWGGDLILEVSDNGTGFSPESIPVVSRHGLLGMKERAELIGADFQIISQPGKGTTMRLRIPDWGKNA